MGSDRSAALAATDPIFELAEGIIWDSRVLRVPWVDIWAGGTYSGVLGTSGIENVTSITLDQTTGAVALTEDGGLLVAAARGLATINPEGAVSIGPDLLNGRPNAKLNDGGIDPQGRFIVGSAPIGNRDERRGFCE